jgi:hypothetical protein
MAVHLRRNAHETEALDEATRERVKLLKKKRKFAALGRSQ